MTNANNETTAFEGWGVVEVMGHRTIAGRLSEVSVAGTKMLRIDVPGHGGRCVTCRGSGKDRWSHVRVEPCDSCNGTGKAASEEAEFIATQLYGATALFSITPTTEEAARAVALSHRPEPMAQLPALPAAPITLAAKARSVNSDEIPF